MKRIPQTSRSLSRKRAPNVHPLLKLGTVLAMIIGLVACGGSDPDTSRVAQARFGDMKALNASKVSVFDQNGKELYAQGLDCEQVVNCRMQLENYKPPAQLSFKLYNPQNQLVSVSDVYSTDQDQFSLSYSDTMLGTYLFRTYAARYEVTPAQLSVQLASFFINAENTDGTPDHFLELGKLYQQVRQDPKLGYGEDKFYTELKIRLDSHFVLPPNYLKNPVEPVTKVATTATRRLLAAAKDASCPPALEVVVEVVKDYGKYIPYVGEAVGKFFGKLIGATVSRACNESDKIVDQLSEINTKLDEIQEQIHELDAKIVALGYSIEQLKEAVYQVLEGTALGRFYDDFNKISSYTNTYRNMLNPPSGQQYKNLSEFVKKYGGLKKSTFDGSTLYTLLRSTAGQNQTFKGLALKSNLDSLATAIKLKCEDETQITDDVVDKRGRCNMMLGKISSEFSQAQTQLALMMKDEIAMIHAEYLAANANDRKWIELNFVSPFSTGWDTAQIEVNQTLEKNLGEFGNALGSSFVPVLKGLPPFVQLGLTMYADCRSDETTMTATTNVSAWYPNEPDPYLTAHCYNNGKWVESKLQYDAKDMHTLYRNILGVPVVVRTSNKFTDRSTSWFQTGPTMRQYYPWDDHSKNGLTVKLNPKEFAVNNEPFPPKRIMSPNASYKYPETCNHDCNSLPGQGGGARYVMTKDLSLPASDFEYFTSRLDATEVGEQYIAATISYTVPAGKGADSGTTLVWQVELQDDVLHEYGYNGYSHPFQSAWRLRCLTADCSVDGDHLRFKHNSSVSRVSLEGPRDGWKSFVIGR